MSSITDLPCEVVACVLRNLTSVRHLLSSILTCRHFYTSFQENSGLRSEVLLNQLTQALLPYSIAVMEASKLQRPPTAASIKAILDSLYNDPAQLTARARTLSLKEMQPLGHIHDVIERSVEKFAMEAWTKLGRKEPAAVGKLMLSPTEHFRFCRAFYRVELYFNLFRGDRVHGPEFFPDIQTTWFFSKHPAWLNEQLACVHDFLEREFSKASLEVVAHDVDFGEHTIDYMSNGWFNFWKQEWIAQGVVFIDKLVNEKSYEAKRALLKPIFSPHKAFFMEATMRAGTADRWDDRQFLIDYSDEEIEALNPRRDEEDNDQGPLLVWRSGNAAGVYTGSVFSDDAHFFRECAYVLWDLERLERYALRKIFEEDPAPLAADYTDEEHAEMIESFDERSKIWQKGGSGYWSKGDTSKIKW